MVRAVNGDVMAPAKGKLAVLMPGMGAVATTFMAGVEAMRQGLLPAVGAVSQQGRMEMEEGQGKTVAIADTVNLASLDQIVFGGWDIYEGTAYDGALVADVLSPAHLEAVKPCLSAIQPMKAVFEQKFVRNLSGPNVKTGESKKALAAALREDIRNFVADNGCDRAVVVWCGSTESYVEAGEVHQTLEAFEQGLADGHPEISPSMMYAYAALSEGVPFANGAPNLTVDCPALVELAKREGVAIAGKDFKTGQTLVKTILAPGFAARYLGVHGWYSTNILGNRDGAVLDAPENFKTKEESKLSVLDSILDREAHPELYDEMIHKVRIDYYPPRGDNKEGWDNIDIFGWMGYPMQIKVNFLCRDSILAAPLVLDLALFIDAAQRAGNVGVQDWLSFYFKAPQEADGTMPAHDLFVQRRALDKELRRLAKMPLAVSGARTVAQIG